MGQGITTPWTWKIDSVHHKKGLLLYQWTLCSKTLLFKPNYLFWNFTYFYLKVLSRKTQINEKAHHWLSSTLNCVVAYRITSNLVLSGSSARNRTLGAHNTNTPHEFLERWTLGMLIIFDQKYKDNFVLEVVKEYLRIFPYRIFLGPYTIYNQGV